MLRSDTPPAEPSPPHIAGTSDFAPYGAANAPTVKYTFRKR